MIKRLKAVAVACSKHKLATVGVIIGVASGAVLTATTIMTLPILSYGAITSGVIIGGFSLVAGIGYAGYKAARDEEEINPSSVLKNMVKGAVIGASLIAAALVYGTIGSNLAMDSGGAGIGSAIGGFLATAISYSGLVVGFNKLRVAYNAERNLQRADAIEMTRLSILSRRHREASRGEVGQVLENRNLPTHINHIIADYLGGKGFYRELSEQSLPWVDRISSNSSRQSLSR